jgi:hypothetical protein
MTLSREKVRSDFAFVTKPCLRSLGNTQRVLSWDLLSLRPDVSSRKLIFEYRLRKFDIWGSTPCAVVPI